MAVTAEIRMTAGLVTLVIDIAPATSEYVVSGGPPRKAETRHATPSPDMVRWIPGSLTKSFFATALTTYTSPICPILVL